MMRVEEMNRFQTENATYKLYDDLLYLKQVGEFYHAKDMFYAVELIAKYLKFNHRRSTDEAIWCIFCNNEVTVTSTKDGLEWRVNCSKCKSHGPTTESEIEAIHAWEACSND